MSNRILIIEDEFETSKYLTKALEMEGFMVETAENGAIGMEKIRQTKFDLIVLDLKMPGKSGDEVLEEIRSLDPYLYVVVYTNYNDPIIMQKLINLGVDGFIKKGASADLWGTVEFIKSKFAPVDDGVRKVLLNDLFQSIKESNTNEVLC